MSWIFGILRKNNQAVLPKKGYYPFKSRDKFSVETKDHYFACGAGNNNSFYKYDHKIDSGWMVCGTGISYEDSAFHLMDFHDWEVFLSKKNNNIRNLNGHFIIVEWENCNSRIRNDQLGMRDMFFTQTDEYVAFSTRLDWLIPLVEKPEIDFTVYGSTWLYVNSFNYKSFVRNVLQLGQGGEATFKGNRFSKVNKQWLPEFTKAVPQKGCLELLSELSTLGLKQNKRLLFGLSGGLDSRVILSILLKEDMNKWETYTFGDYSFPDIVIAQKIAEKIGFEHSTISELLPPKSEEVERFTEFVLETNTFMNGYYFYEQDHYKHLDNNLLLIDGGQGAFCRRNHSKYLWLKGKKYIIMRDAEGVLRYITLNKPMIFNKDTARLMKQGSILEINEVFDNMPNISDIGSGNWVDLFTIRYHCSNTGALTQSRLDNIICNYMPIFQPSFLKRILSLPVSLRAYNRIYRHILQKGNSTLRQISIVKDMSIIPFTMNNYVTFVLGKLFERFQKSQTIDYSQLFLVNNKEYVMDTLQSRGVKEYPYYDYNKIQNLVEGYYQGQKSYSKSVLWWLTFDVWRKKLQDHQMNT